MAQFNLTNHWIEFRYTTEAMQHVQKFQVESTTTVPTVNPVDVLLVARDTSLIPLSVFGGDWTTVLAPFFSATDSSFDSMTLWYQPDGVLEPTFISGVDTSALGWIQPSSGAGGVLGAQETYTFRAADGRILKIVLVEATTQPHSRLTLPSIAAPAIVAFVDYMLGTTCVVKSRSDAFPLFALNRTVVFNDKIVRKRFNVD